ncbi:helix-turn-helix domain-containing protein [Nocardia sp. NPDC003693]
MKSHTLPARLMGMTLEALRERIRPAMSREAAAKLLGLSQQTLWRYERAQWEQPPKKVSILAMCRLYDADIAEQETILDLLGRASESGWWQKFDNAMTPGFSQFVARENSAQRMISYQDTLLPGMLQTAEYRRAMAYVIDPNAPEDSVTSSIAVATMRQGRLEETSQARLEVVAVLAERVLRQTIGGAAVMRDQLERLLTLVEIPTVSIRIIPEGTPHIGLATGPFVVLESPKSDKQWIPDEPPTVYLQHFTGSLYLGRDEEVQKYYRAFEGIAEASVSSEESRALISRIAKDLEQ